VTLHKDFIAATPAHQWRGGLLRALFVRLTEAAFEHPGSAQWFVLPSGAFVSLKVSAGRTRELRIRRLDEFKTARGPQLWEKEVDTFMQEFAIAHWTRVADSAEKGGVGVIFVEPHSNSTPHVRCSWKGCPEIVMWQPAFTQSHCNAHARSNKGA
jgi:hypothetical protein